MDREIKFRAWNKYSNQWEEEGWCIQKHIPWNVPAHETGMTVYWLEWVDWIDGMEPFYALNGIAKKTDLILCQYTGLKDKNGKEIYEGDIVRILNLSPTHETSEYKLGQIRYESNCGGYIVNYTFSKNQHHDLLTCDEAIDAEIIGNIYENPELVEK